MVPPPLELQLNPPALPEPDWVCECGFLNKARNTKCGGSGPMGCKKPRFEPTVAEDLLGTQTMLAAMHQDVGAMI